MATKVVLPQMGEAVIEATITKWLKKEGDAVSEYEPLVEVNTDKVDSEVPSPVTGTVLKIAYPEGATVPINSPLVWIGEPGEDVPEGEEAVEAKAAPSKAAKPPAPVPAPSPAAPPKPAAAPPRRTPKPSSTALSGFISPVVARVADAHEVDLSQVTGTGPGGRIVKQDVLAFVAARDAQPPAPPSDVRATFVSPVVSRLAAEHNIDLNTVRGTGQFGRITKKDMEAIIAGGLPAPARKAAPVSPSAAIPGTVMKLSTVRTQIAQHMVHSKHTSPHVTTVMEADLNRVFVHRSANKPQFARQGINLTFTAYFVSASAQALQIYPLVNSSWTEAGVAIHKEINVGMATTLGEEGLIVPVIKNADSLSLLDTARAVNDLAERARGKKLLPDEVQGGTFTITNHGTSGSLFATPIINQPQCAILGTGIIQKRPVVINDAIAIRPMVYLGLTFDHRILDGQAADFFLMKIVETLQTWS